MNSAISVFAAHAHDRAGNLDLDRAVATTVQLHEHSCVIRFVAGNPGWVRRYPHWTYSLSCIGKRHEDPASEYFCDILS
jgi:hypothetical protein